MEKRYTQVFCEKRRPVEKYVADTDKGKMIYHPLLNQWRTLEKNWKEKAPTWWLEELPPPPVDEGLEERMKSAAYTIFMKAIPLSKFPQDDQFKNLNAEGYAEEVVEAVEVEEVVAEAEEVEVVVSEDEKNERLMGNKKQAFDAEAIEAANKETIVKFEKPSFFVDKNN